MQFVVIAHDFKDDNALERRLAVRELHLKYAAEMHKTGKWLLGSALLDEEGNMNGTIIFCDYPSEEILRNEWLENEVYIIGNVWETVTIRKVKIAKHD